MSQRNTNINLIISLDNIDCGLQSRSDGARSIKK